MVDIKRKLHDSGERKVLDRRLVASEIEPVFVVVVVVVELKLR